MVAKREPNWLTMMAMVPVLVAGPVIRNTSAAPGLNPFATKAAAMGVLADAQMYNGTPTSTMAG